LASEELQNLIATNAEIRNNSFEKYENEW